MHRRFRLMIVDDNLEDLHLAEEAIQSRDLPCNLTDEDDHSEQLGDREAQGAVHGPSSTDLSGVQT